MNHRHQSGGAGGVSDSNLCHRNYRIEARIWTRWLNSRSGVDRGKRQTKESKMTIALNVILFFLFFSLSLSLSLFHFCFFLTLFCVWISQMLTFALLRRRPETKPSGEKTRQQSHVSSLFPRWLVAQAKTWLINAIRASLRYRPCLD